MCTDDKTTIANAFNKYFTELGPNRSKNIPISKSSLFSNACRQIRDSIAIAPTDSIEIKNIISEMKHTSSSGVDHIPISVLKSVKTKISSILSILINHSITNGAFPDALKVARITPILKQGNKALITNYRPISLLNTFSKIYEKVFSNRLNNFFAKHNIIYMKVNSAFKKIIRPRTLWLHLLIQLLNLLTKMTTFSAYLSTLVKPLTPLTTQSYSKNYIIMGSEVLLITI